MKAVTCKLIGGSCACVAGPCFDCPEWRAGRVSIIKRNAMNDPNYAPYCLRCVRPVRMVKVEHLLWNHHCGAVHDEREVK